MISQTLFAVSDNESRPIHTGSLFEVDSEGLTIVSVDATAWPSATSPSTRRRERRPSPS